MTAPTITAFAAPRGGVSGLRAAGRALSPRDERDRRRPAAFLDLAPMSRAEGIVALPGSKSISNRTLLLAALATGDTKLEGLLDADDVDRMQER